MKKNVLFIITILITTLLSSAAYAELILKDYIFSMNTRYSGNEKTLNVEVSFSKLYDEFIIPGYEHYLKSGTLYVGIYDNDNLVSLASEYIGERKISEHKAFMTFPANVLIKDKTYQIRGFIWDNNMEPIGDCREVEYTHITENFTVERDVSLFDGYSDNILKIRNSANGLQVTEYKLNDNYELYVNNILLNTADLDFEHLFAGADGNVKLIDTDVNGEYDKVYIDEFYYTAIVSHVVTSFYETKICFKQSSGIAESMTLYKNSRYKYNFIKNGTEILPSELKENDVLSIKYDLNDGFDRSSFYDVQVCDYKVSGTVTRISTNSNEKTYYRINGVDYAFAIGVTDEIIVGRAYSFFLTFNNKIGYIVDTGSIYNDEFTIDTQMAIVKKVSTTLSNSINRVLLTIILDGIETPVICKDTSSKYLNLVEGDAIIFNTDSEGYVDELYTIMNVNIASATRYDLFKAIYNDNVINADLPTITFDGEAVEYVLAPVVDKTASSITLGAVEFGNTIGDKTLTMGKYAWYMNAAGDDTLSYDADIKVYTFNGEKTNGYKVNISAPAAVAKTFAASASVNSTSYLDAAGLYINLGMEGMGADMKSTNTVAFALLRVHDGIVKEVYSISMPETDRTAEFQIK